MGDKINVLLDDLLALLTRLLNMPLWFQLSVYSLLSAVIWVFIFFALRLLKKPLEQNSKRWIFVSTTLFMLIISAAGILDYKNHLLEISRTTSQVGFIPIQKDTAVAQSPLTFINHIDTVKHNNITPNETTGYVYHTDGIEIIQYKVSSPIATAYIAAVDLTKYQVVLDTAISVKELTSTFSKRFNADIAVNGEAGTTPGKTAPLGQWIGNYIVNGKVILNKDSKNRPMVYFDKDMTAYYSAEREVITSFNDKMYNAIWGRYDLLINGKLAISPHDGTKNNPYPRTIIGMDKAGKKIFLMVVDGRKPTHSMGMTMKQCGDYLLKVGCYNAMACDQGGSSVMYAKSLGIISKPADGGERVTYTHIGFRRNK